MRRCCAAAEGTPSRGAPVVGCRLLQAPAIKRSSCAVAPWSRQRRLRVAAGRPAPNRNPYRELQRDLLPSGDPNTPWRRLLLRIKNAWSLRQLLELYERHHFQSYVFKDRHRAALLQRIPNIIYYRVVAAPGPDAATAQQLEELLLALAPELARPAVLRLVDGRKLCQLLVCVARCRLALPLHALDPMVRELLSGGAQKVPADTPDLVSELAGAAAALQWWEPELWDAIGASAKALLQQQQRRRRHQQQHQQQEQQQRQQAQQQQQQQQQHAADAAWRGGAQSSAWGDAPSSSSSSSSSSSRRPGVDGVAAPSRRGGGGVPAWAARPEGRGALPPGGDEDDGAPLPSFGDEGDGARLPSFGDEGGGGGGDDVDVGGGGDDVDVGGGNRGAAGSSRAARPPAAEGGASPWPAGSGEEGPSALAGPGAAAAAPAAAAAAAAAGAAAWEYHGGLPGRGAVGFLAQDLAALSRALGLAGVQDGDLLAALGEEAARKAPIMCLSQLTDVLGGFAALGRPHAGLQAAAEARLGQLLPAAGAGEGLEALAALAALQPVPRRLLVLLGQVVMDAGKGLDLSQVAQLLGVMAAVPATPPRPPPRPRQQQPPVAVGDAALWGGPGGGGGGGARAGGGGAVPPSLLGKALGALRGAPLSGWTPELAERCARCLALLRPQAHAGGAAALGAVAAAARALAPSCTARQLSGVLWGLAVCGHREPLLLEAVAEALRLRPPAAVGDGGGGGGGGSLEAAQAQRGVEARYRELLEGLPELTPSTSQATAAGISWRRRVGSGGSGSGAGGGAPDAAGRRGGGGGAGGGAGAAAGGVQRGVGGKGAAGAARLGVQHTAELVWALQEYGRQDLLSALLLQQSPGGG